MRKFEPKTIRTGIIVLGAIFIASMVTGYFPELIDFLAGIYNKLRCFLPGVKA